MDPDGLRATVGELFAQRLDRSRPLWRIDVLPLRPKAGARSSGASTTRSRTAPRRYGSLEPSSSTPGPGAGKLRQDQPATHAAEDDARRRHHLAGLLRREFARSRIVSLPSMPGSGRGAKSSSRGCRSDLCMTAPSASPAPRSTTRFSPASRAVLRRWIEQHHGQLDDLRVKVPVSLHQAGRLGR